MTLSAKTLSEAWLRYAGPLEEVPDGLEYQYHFMQVSFYIGAATVYQMAADAKKMNTHKEALDFMGSVFDELDFFMQTLPHLDPYDRRSAGNA